MVCFFFCRVYHKSCVKSLLICICTQLPGGVRGLNYGPSHTLLSLFVYTSSEGSDETVHVHSLIRVLILVSFHCLPLRKVQFCAGYFDFFYLFQELRIPAGIFNPGFSGSYCISSGHVTHSTPPLPHPQPHILAIFCPLLELLLFS